MLYFACETIKKYMLKTLQIFPLLLCLFLNTQLASQSSLGGGCDVIFTLGDNDTLCTNSNIFSLPDAFPFGGVYSGPGVSNYSFDPSVTGVGQFEITYTYEDENCSSSATVIMTVINGDELELVGDFLICEGESTIIGSGSTAEYTWADGSKSAFKEFTPTETVVTTATGTDSNGCIVVTEFTITVGTVPDAIVTGETQLCLGDTAFLSVSNAPDFQWSTGSINENIELIIQEPETIELTIFGDNCDSIISIYVSVLPFPQMTISYDQFICQGDTVFVVGEGAAYYRSFLGNFDSTFYFIPTGYSTFSVQGFNENGCSVFNEFAVNVGVNTPITLSESSATCSGQTQTLYAEGTDGYRWENLDENVVIQEGFVSFLDFSPEVTTNYRVSGLNDDGCGESIDFTILVYPLPELSITPQGIICEGKIIDLLASGAQSYLWNQDNTENPFSTVAEANEIVSVIGYSEFGCESSFEYELFVNPVPVASITGSFLICDGETSTLTAGGADIFEWSTGDITSQIIVQPSSDSLFTVTVTNEFGCTDFTNFTVNVRPSPFIDFIGPDTICAGELFHLSYETNGDFAWGDGSTSAFVEFIAATDSLVEASSAGENGCVNTQFFSLVVNELPEIEITGNNVACAFQPLTLIASGGESYEWNTGADTPIVEVIPVVGTNYRVYGMGENGCVREVIFPISVNPSPYVYFSFNQDTVCNVGEAFSWLANPAGGVYSGDGVVNNQIDPTFAITGENETSYTVTNAFNCSTTVMDVIYVDDCTFVDERNSESILVYPNPTDETLYVESGVNKITELTLFNSIGSVVLNESNRALLARVVLNVQSLPAGIYELRFQTEDRNSISRKVIIK